MPLPEMLTRLLLVEERRPERESTRAGGPRWRDRTALGDVDGAGRCGAVLQREGGGGAAPQREGDLGRRWSGAAEGGRRGAAVRRRGWRWERGIDRREPGGVRGERIDRAS